MTWDSLEANCAACTACELHKTKTRTVFGTGNREATLMFVGEAPGETEDETGIPSISPAKASISPIS